MMIMLIIRSKMESYHNIILSSLIAVAKHEKTGKKLKNMNEEDDTNLIKTSFESLFGSCELRLFHADELGENAQQFQIAGRCDVIVSRHLRQELGRIPRY